jgi:kynurenine 3-monooxygenase
LRNPSAEPCWNAGNQCINSIDRADLNKDLLDQVEKLPNVKIRFRHKLLRADFDGKKLEFQVDGGRETLKADADFVVGADGAFSKVREQMMRIVRYVELII